MSGENPLQQLLTTVAAVRESFREPLRDQVAQAIYRESESIARNAVVTPAKHDAWDRRIDNVVTSRCFGYPIMFALLTLVFWLTVAGANVPSALLGNWLFGLQDQLTALSHWIGMPDWLHGVLILGLYRCLAWVVSVMLPPMAIFFPLFTFLEDLGYLPRIAFNLDHLFKKAGAHGKQILTMCMGFGCNAAGIVACRIIESPRERLIAILTNNFVPCNGRFPTLITTAAILGALLLHGYNSGVITLLVALVVLLGVFTTLGVSWLLSKTLLKGVPSTFTLELPPYRLPKLGTLLIRSILDRTLFVLLRAVTVAAPAGALIWILANVQLGGVSIITYLAGGLQGVGHAIGLDGYILLAFILGLPANEIVLPILIMVYLSQGTMVEFDSIAAVQQLFVSHGWTWLTACNLLLFSLLHFPCATTLLTIRQETQSAKWTWLAALIPTASAFLACLIIAQAVRLLGLV